MNIYSDIFFCKIFDINIFGHSFVSICLYEYIRNSEFSRMLLSDIYILMKCVIQTHLLQIHEKLHELYSFLFWFISEFQKNDDLQGQDSWICRYIFVNISRKLISGIHNALIWLSKVAPYVKRRRQVSNEPLTHTWVTDVDASHPSYGGDCLIRKESGLVSLSRMHLGHNLYPNTGSTPRAIQQTRYWPNGHQGQLSSVGYATFENFPRVSSCAAPKLLDSLCRWRRQFSTVPGQSGAAAVRQLFIGGRPDSGPVGIEVKESKEGDTSAGNLWRG